MGTLFTIDETLLGVIFKVKTKKGVKERRPELLSTVCIPNGILSSNENHIVVDKETGKLVLAAWHGMLGDIIKSAITDVCEVAFKLRRGGTRGKD